MPHYFAEGDLPWVFNLSEAATLTDLLANLPTYTRERCGLLHLGDAHSEDALEMLAVALAGKELSQFYLLLERVPPEPTLLRSLIAGGMQVGVYLPTEQPKIADAKLAVVLQTADRLAALRKLHTLLGTVFVLADADAVQDARHFAELVGPHAESLVFLTSATAEEAKKIRMHFDAIKQDVGYQKEF